MRISDWSSDVCSSDLVRQGAGAETADGLAFLLPLAGEGARRADEGALRRAPLFKACHPPDSPACASQASLAFEQAELSRVRCIRITPLAPADHRTTTSRRPTFLVLPVCHPEPAAPLARP